jgi:signal transduction histidine kinase
VKRLALTQPLGRLLCVALYGLAAGVTVRVTGDGPAYALAGDSTVALAAELLAGLLLLAAGLALLRPGSRFALLIVAAALAWPGAEWGSPAAGAAFTPGLVVSTLWVPLLAAAALLGPDGRGLTRPARVLLAVAFTAEVGLAIASAAVFDPAGEGCAECPANRLLLAADPVARHDLVRVGLLLSAAWTAAFVLLSVLRLARSTPPRRRRTGLVVVPAAAAVALFGASALHGLARGFRSNDAIDRALWAGQLAAIVLVAAGVAAELLRTRRRRAGLQRLVLDLGAVGSGSLSERLGKLLGDPSLVLVYARDDDEWVDARGRRDSPSTGTDRQVTYMWSRGRRIAALVHRAGLLADPAIVAEIETTARLALEHERLQAVRLAQLDDLRATSARIVARADAERRGLERDLHDGAQQRLVTAAVGVRLARRRHGHGTALEAELARVERGLSGAVAELRRLGHGLFPATLDAEGLAAALELLAEEQPRLVLRTLPGGRCPAAVESAAYHLVEQAAAMAPSGDVEVDADRRDARLVIEVRAAFAGPVPLRVSDRIGAAGGTLDAEARRLRAEMPCAS